MRAHAGVHIFNVKGKKMIAPYHRPEGVEGKKFPTVVFLHGFPGAEKNVDIQRELMSRGVASVAPNFLGAWGSGGVYRFTTLAEQARSVLKAIRTLDYVNSQRIGIFGFSMGGWAALNAAAEEPTIKATVAIAPVGGAEMAREGTLGFVARLSRPLNTIASRALAADFVKAVTKDDPALAASKIRGPLLIVHGEKDETVPVTVSKRIAAAAPRARLVIEPGAGHDFLDRRPRLTRLCANFFQHAL